MGKRKLSNVSKYHQIELFLAVFRSFWLRLFVARACSLVVSDLLSGSSTAASNVQE